MGRTCRSKPALPPVTACAAYLMSVCAHIAAKACIETTIYSGILSISRVPPIRAATNSRAGSVPGDATGASVAASRSSA